MNIFLFLTSGLSYPWSRARLCGRLFRSLQKLSQPTSKMPYLMICCSNITESPSLRTLWTRLCCWTLWQGRSPFITLLFISILFHYLSFNTTQPHFYLSLSVKLLNQLFCYIVFKYIVKEHE